MSRGSQFDEKKDFIEELFAAGASVKEIWKEMGTDWYSYEALYAYIRNNFGKQVKKACKCEQCKQLVYMESPYKSKQIPVCVERKKVFKIDKSGMPHSCDLFTEKGA